MKIIVSDTGPLIALAKTQNLFILKRLFKKVFIPPAVLEELYINENLPGSKNLCAAIKKEKWIELKKIKKITSLISYLDLGEAEAIAISLELKLPLLIDEKRARKTANKLNIEVIGLGRILIAAKTKKLVPNVTIVLSQLDQSGYRLSKRLKNKIQLLAKEG